MRILIIDDSPDRGDGLRSRLDELGRSARWVRDPLFALTLLAADTFDAVFVTGDLADAINTAEFCKLLQVDPSHAMVHLVVYDTSRTLRAAKPEAADSLVREGQSLARLARLLIEEVSLLTNRGPNPADPRSGPASLLHGSLELFDVSELIQMICRPERSFRLTMHFALGDALLTVARGRLIHAELNHLCGETAVKRLVALGSENPDTRFTLLELSHHIADSTPPTIDIGVQELLLRASVALDEDRRAASSSRSGSA